MARDFNGSTQALEHNSAGLTFPLTMAAWVRADSFTAGATLLASVNSANSSYHALFYSGTGVPQLETNLSGGGLGTATAAAAQSTGAWAHVAGVVSAADARAVYLNGGSKGTNATSVTPSGLNQAKLMQYKASDFVDGRCAEAAIWSAALTDDEILSLARGISPSRIRRPSLWGYWPILGLSSPEPDLSGNGRAMSLVGAPPQADHAPILRRQLHRLLQRG